MENRYAVIDQNGLVLFCIMMEPDADWPKPEGTELVQTDEAGPDWTYLDGVFTEPVVIPPVLTFEVSVYNKLHKINKLRDLKKSLSILTQGYQVDAGDLDAGMMATKIYAATLTGTAIASITNSGGVATVTTDENHHLKTGATATMAGADQSEYNVTEGVTKTGPKEFTYPIAGAPVMATGTLTFSVETMRFIPTTNEVAFVDAAVYREIYLDIESYVDACQINARGLKNQVIAAVDIAEVDAIDISIGWPNTGI